MKTVLCLLVLLVLAVTGRAALSPLTAVVQPLTLRPRTEAPAAIDIHLHSQSRVLLEGTLEIQFASEGELLVRQQIPDLAFAYGVSHRRLLLPPPPAGQRFLDELRLQFTTRSGVYDLGRFPIAGASMALRHYLVGFCQVESRVSEKRSLVWQALRPERLFASASVGASSFVSAPVWFAPDDLPTPVGLCAFDAIVFEGPSLAALAPKQLADLTTWVEAGGSLGVVSPSALDAEHVSFLNRLGGSPKTPEPFARNPDGTIAPSPAAGKSSDANVSFHFRKAKLGRFFISFDAPESEAHLMDAGWVKATHFLAHSDSAATQFNPPQGDEWSGPQIWRGPQVLNGPQGGAWATSGPRWGSQSREDEVQSRLLANLPHSARIIPIPVVSAIVGVFVLLVGPGEWFVLGWLRRRRWTWVTFPAIAAGCTLFTVRAAEYYLGTNDQQLALVITDFSPDGRALRENRLELWFAGRSGEAVSEMRQALAVPAGNEPPNPRAGAAQPGAIYQGLVPAHYTLRRRLSQWTPYLQRSLTFTPNPATAHLRWEALTKLPTYGFTAVPAAVTTTTYADPHAAEYIAKQIGADGWAVSVFQFGKLASGFRVPGGGDALAMLLSVGPISPYSPRRGIRKDAAVTPEPWTTAISPSGQPDLLDLLLDHAKADWVVVAERQVGREIQIQRCVYRFDSDD